MNIDRTSHIADIVAALPAAAGVFDATGIDYSSPGERSIEEAAGLEGVDPNSVVLQLRRLPPPDRGSWLDRSMRDLLDFLAGQHSRIMRDDLVHVAEELADVCGWLSAEPALERLREEFKALSTALLPHLRREQEIVFPLIQRVESMWQSNAPPPSDNGVEKAITDLLVEHGAIAARARLVRDLRMTVESHDVSTACRTMLRDLARLEADLRYSMFLENCVLFPGALALHESLSGSPVTSAE